MLIMMYIPLLSDQSAVILPSFKIKHVHHIYTWENFVPSD